MTAALSRLAEPAADAAIAAAAKTLQLPTIRAQASQLAAAAAKQRLSHKAFLGQEQFRLRPQRLQVPGCSIDHRSQTSRQATRGVQAPLTPRSRSFAHWRSWSERRPIFRPSRAE